MKPTDEQLRILRHMLGIDVNDTPNPAEYRDYYCANQGDQQMHAMAALGLVRLHSTGDRYEWFTTTELGKAAARESQKAMLLPKPRRVYLRWLAARDALHDLTFREFLTSKDFAQIRANA